MGIVELLHKLTGRVINYGTVPARGNLIKHLANDARLTGTRVTHDQEMLVFRIARNAQRAPGIVGRDADSIAGNGFGELTRTNQKWSLQSAAITQFLRPRDVSRN